MIVCTLMHPRSLSKAYLSQLDRFVCYPTQTRCYVASGIGIKDLTLVASILTNHIQEMSHHIPYACCHLVPAGGRYQLEPPRAYNPRVHVITPPVPLPQLDMQRVPHTPGPHSSFDFDSGLSGGDLSPYSAHAYPSQGLAHDHNGYIHEDQGPHAIYAYAQPNHSPSSLESQQYSTPGSFFPSETLPLPESAIEPITTDPIFGQAHPHDDEATVAVEPLQDALPPPHYRVVGSQRTTDAAHKRRKHDGRTMKLYRCPICQQELTSNANLSGKNIQYHRKPGMR